MSVIDSHELSLVEVQELITLIHQYTGMTIGDSKKSLIQGRIRPRMRTLGLQAFNEYINYLKSHSSEIQEFINQITTNETSFFRTPRIWEYLEKVFLPEWKKSGGGKPLRIWSGAASSGEEIYSIAMTCCEWQKAHPGFEYSVLGTDISTQVLKVAEAGRYSGKSIEGLRKTYPHFLKKYFKETPEYCEVLPLLRSKVRFMQRNLLDAFDQHFDLVFLRNVLIYFERSEQQKILENAASTLPDGGRIILGESESLAGLETPFKFVSPLIYEKRSSHE
jgi:chemotaxis protein methyltransferase CheR